MASNIYNFPTNLREAEEILNESLLSDQELELAAVMLFENAGEAGLTEDEFLYALNQVKDMKLNGMLFDMMMEEQINVRFDLESKQLMFSATRIEGDYLIVEGNDHDC